jgi:hypothetical protein
LLLSIKAFKSRQWPTHIEPLYIYQQRGPGLMEYLMVADPASSLEQAYHGVRIAYELDLASPASIKADLKSKPDLLTAPMTWLWPRGQEMLRRMKIMRRTIWKDMPMPSQWEDDE